MRPRSLLLALVAALTMHLPVQAGAVLGFAIGNGTNFAADPGTLPPDNDPTNMYPESSFAMEDWSTGTQKLGTTNGATIGTNLSNPYVMQLGSKVVLQIQLVDTNPKLFSYSIASRRLQSWGGRLIFQPGVVTATPDPSMLYGPKTAYDVSTNDFTGGTNGNLADFNDDRTYNNSNQLTSLGIGNLDRIGPWWITTNTSPFTYTLANVVLTADGLGDAEISFGRRNATSTDWMIQAAPHYRDSTVFANTPELFIRVVPEPASMTLVGIALGGLAFHFRRGRRPTLAA